MGSEFYTSPSVAVIPASIVTAVCEIKKSLDSVKKSQRNQHGGYQFSSTDDIYAALTRKMGEVGLMCIGMEDKAEVARVEKTDKDGRLVITQWAHMVFSFVLATKDGTWSDPRARRSLYIQVTGPQTFQAAQSYCEKAYLRSLFKLPTGDLDLDSMPQGESEDDQIALSQPKKRKSSAGAKKDGTTEVFNEIRRDIAATINPEHLRHVRLNFADEWGAMPAAWGKILDEEYEDKMEAFGLSEAAE